MIDFDTARSTVMEIVAEYGEDTYYIPADAKNKMCDYAWPHPEHPSGPGGCLIGLMWGKLGVTRSTLGYLTGTVTSANDQLPNEFQLDFRAKQWCNVVQSQQDSGVTWGEAVRVADMAWGGPDGVR